MKARAWLPIAVAILLSGCASGPHKVPWWSSDVMNPAPPHHTAGAIYASNDAQDVFSDVSAHRVGDVITVLVNEQAAATKQASTQVNRQSSIADSATGGIQSGSLGNLASLSTSSKNKFTGGGQAAQKNSFSTTLTATIVHVLPDGNFAISGHKKVVLDQGPETIALRGIVRPSSIGPDNTVSSGDIADETIRYTGSGTLQSSQHMGWLQKLLMTVWPF